MVDTTDTSDNQQQQHPLLASILALASARTSYQQQQHDLLSSIEELIHLSQSDQGRAKLASLHAVPLLLSVFPHLLSAFLEQPVADSKPLLLLLLLLKLLRNLCAGEASNQNAFLESDGVDAVASMLQKLIASPKCSSSVCVESQIDNGRNLSIDVIRMALQLLGNLCGGGETQTQAVWRRLFPSLFLGLATTGGEKVLEPLCMVIYSCCRVNKARLMNLFHGEGALLMSAIFTTAIESAAGEWLQLLVSQICLLEPFLPLLFANLGASPQQGAQATFSSEQAFLLEILSALLSEELEKNSEKLDVRGERALYMPRPMPMPTKSILFIVEVIKQASTCPRLGYKSPKKLPTGVPGIDVLGYALGVVKIVSIWEFDTVSGSNLDPSVHCEYQWKRDTSIMAHLSTCGLIKLCLKLLEELGPPELIHKFMQQEANNCTVLERKGDEDKLNKTNVLSAHGSHVDNQGLRYNIPYECYRRDLLAIIGNAAYQNKAVQNEVREMGGLFLILQHCVTDRENPFLREWGLWAVRNLLEGNDENQREVADMELKGSPSTPQELAQIGLKVVINPETGRPRLVNVTP